MLCGNPLIYAKEFGSGSGPDLDSTLNKGGSAILDVFNEKSKYCVLQIL